jgi:hypothetical protein
MKFFSLRNLYVTLPLLAACGSSVVHNPEAITLSGDSLEYIETANATFATFRLDAGDNSFTENEKEMLRCFIEAAEIMDSLFWEQAFGDPESLRSRITQPVVRSFVDLNYGPWERLNNNQTFLPGFGPKPLGANLYPPDLDAEKFAAWNHPKKSDQYSMVRYNSAGELTVIPYSEYFKEPLTRAANLLRKAAELSEDEGLKTYLNLRADAFLSDDYVASDRAWMDMKTNRFDLVIGPIENYEDKLSGSRTAFEAYVLVKDMEWSERLARYTPMLPRLQAGMPVPEAYKPKLQDADSEINAYQVLYYAGDCNAGSKTIAINLPNDPEIQATKGTRRLQLKNAIQAKYDKILVPIAQELIDEEQLKFIGFDAFFATIMFHEVAHGLGIKMLVTNPTVSVADALGAHYAAIEEGKADILGLYMIEQLHAMGELSEPLEAYYLTFMAGIFRSVRFGAASAHGKANMVRFNYFLENGAFERNEKTGRYKVVPANMSKAVAGLSEIILRIQGDGDAQAAADLLENQGRISETLQADLNRLSAKGIPVDIIFEQGKSVLGL